MKSTEDEDESFDSRNGLRPDEMPLQDAWHALAPARLTELYAKAKPTSGAAAYRKKEMQDQLQWKLEGHGYVATGVEHGDKADIGRVQIPAYFFGRSAKIDWSIGKLEVFGRVFAEIYVSKKTNFAGNSTPLKKSELASGQISSRKPGRISKAAEIEIAIEQLEKIGVDLNSMPRQHAFSKIIEFQKSQQISTTIGYSNPVLQRVLFRRYGIRD